jgi:hypothetical protein
LFVTEIQNIFLTLPKPLSIKERGNSQASWGEQVITLANNHSRKSAVRAVFSGI